MYGLNRESRIFDKILYEVDSSDIPHSEKLPKNMENFPMKTG
jgi:hypothetical protein